MRPHLRIVPSTPHQPPQPSALDIEGFSPPFDILYELHHHRDTYTGTDWLQIPGYPNSLRTVVDRIRACVQCPTSKPSLSATISCLIYRGLDIISSNADMERLFELKASLDGHEHLTPDEIGELALWIRSFPMSIVDMSGQGTRRLNLTIPSELKVGLVEVSNELGTEFASLAIISQYACLAEQQSNIVRNKQDVTATLERFYSRLSVRRRMIEVLLASL